MQTAYNKVWKNILTYDIEAENHESYGRFASQFCAENWVMAIGWNYNGGMVNHRYYATKEEVPLELLPDISSVDLIVGHNIGYDLLWVWEDPNLTEFFERGGEIWDTQYAEYLIHGMVKEVHMNSMNGIAESYGGGLKVDAVKEMWEAGKLTSEIPRDMLVEYLVGSPAVGLPNGTIVGDVMNTWLIFAGQFAKIHYMHHNFLTMLRGRMDGLLGTTEMEFNGIYANKELGAELRTEVAEEVKDKLSIINQYIPSNIPPELKFNWGSPNHKSALIFGGTITYQKWTAHTDENNQFIYTKKKESWPLFGGKAVNPAFCRISPSKLHFLPVPDDVIPEAVPEAIVTKAGERFLIQDRVKAGKNKGTLKTKQTSVPDYTKKKGAQTDYTFRFPGYCKADKRWETKNLDGGGSPLYSTGEKIVKKLIENESIPFVKDFVRYNKAMKDMETYYWKEDDEGNMASGMLTFVNELGIIHHSLNHTSTVTGRLSSSKPNGQNLPRKGGSKVKMIFESRWGDNGLMAEIDYSQLEVVNQGVLTGDKQLIQDLNDGVDFHIKRLSLKLKRDYNELWKLHHTDGDEVIGAERTKAKVYSFQDQYGAGVATIAYDTGMDVEEVKELKAADALLYPGIAKFYSDLEHTIESSSYVTPEFLYIAGERHPVRRGFWDCPTGTRYMWSQHETPDFIKERFGKLLGFSPTERKNYACQGLGGEIMQLSIGKIFRFFIANKRFDGNVKLVNTVHDCAWLDGVKGWLEPVAVQVAQLMECVPQVLNQMYNMDIPVKYPVELEIGQNMYDMHTVHH